MKLLLDVIGNRLGVGTVVVVKSSHVAGGKWQDCNGGGSLGVDFCGAFYGKANRGGTTGEQHGDRNQQNPKNTEAALLDTFSHDFLLTSEYP